MKPFTPLMHCFTSVKKTLAQSYPTKVDNHIIPCGSVWTNSQTSLIRARIETARTINEVLPIPKVAFKDIPNSLQSTGLQQLYHLELSDVADKIARAIRKDVENPKVQFAEETITSRFFYFFLFTMEICDPDSPISAEYHQLFFTTIIHYDL